MRTLTSEDIEAASGGLKFLDDWGRQAGRSFASFMNDWDSVWGDVSAAWTVYNSLPR